MKRRSFLFGLLGAPLLAVPLARAAESAPVQITQMPHVPSWPAEKGVMLNLTPGETVDIWNPRIVVKGDLFDRVGLRNLVDELNSRT